MSEGENGKENVVRSEIQWWFHFNQGNERSFHPQSVTHSAALEDLPGARVPGSWASLARSKTAEKEVAKSFPAVWSFLSGQRRHGGHISSKRRWRVGWRVRAERHNFSNRAIRPVWSTPSLWESFPKRSTDWRQQSFLLSLTFLFT